MLMRACVVGMPKVYTQCMYSLRQPRKPRKVLRVEGSMALMSRFPYTYVT